MPKVHESWKVLSHRPIEVLDDRLWRVQGTLEGMSLKRVMTIARMDDDRLVIHNAIALDDASMKRIEQWGTPAFLVVPNRYHRLDAPAFKRRYPDLQVLCPEAARKAVAQVVAVDGGYRDFPVDPHVSLFHIEGVRDREGAMMVRGSSGASLVLNDLVFDMPHGKGLAGLVFKHLTQSTGGPRVPRLARLFIVDDPKKVRAHLERLADTPELARIVVSHHRTIDERPAETLREVARTLG